MKLNNFSVIVPEGNETRDGYVELPHAGRYSLRLVNDSALRCDALVETDGKEVGKWRVEANSFIILERPVNDTGYFTFYVAGTSEAKEAGIVRHNDLGLLKVTFTPEKKPIPLTGLANRRYDAGSPLGGLQQDQYFSDPQAEEADMPVFSRSRGDGEPTGGFVEGAPAPAPLRRAGGTGLSGRSDQTFVSASPIDYDENNQVTIHLRLVERDDKTPRPLVGVSRQTPVPPLT
ncbi:MAG: hypothetical protein H7Y38_10465 [Armatimonadetes bacterium]|nr:hypothetical protein [Armatimonadota bacterium]